jgi:hypothetical protein
MFQQSETPFVTGVFCEIFGATDAVRALTNSGFEEHEIDLIGILHSGSTDLRWVLHGLGLPEQEYEFYNSCFEHGAVLVMVRTLPSHRRDIARKVLKRHGGTFPTEA